MVLMKPKNCTAWLTQGKVRSLACITLLTLHQISIRCRYFKSTLKETPKQMWLVKFRRRLRIRCIIMLSRPVFYRSLPRRKNLWKVSTTNSMRAAWYCRRAAAIRISPNLNWATNSTNMCLTCKLRTLRSTITCTGSYLKIMLAWWARSLPPTRLCSRSRRLRLCIYSRPLRESSSKYRHE